MSGKKGVFGFEGLVPCLEGGEDFVFFAIVQSALLENTLGEMAGVPLGRLELFDQVGGDGIDQLWSGH